MKALTKAKGAVKSGLRRFGSAGRSLAKPENLGSFGRKIVKHGSHALLALASRNRNSVGPVPLAPDAIAAGVSAAGMMFLKGRNRKIAGDLLEGSISALISRAVYGSLEIDLSGVVSGQTKAPEPEEVAAE